MAVVRREGDWRLEKRDDGVYEVTYEKHPEVKIITSDYSSDGFISEREDVSIQVREVSSFSEAKSEFDEIAASGAPRPGLGISLGDGGAGSGSSSGSLGAEGNLEDVPTGAVILGCLIVGASLLYTRGITPGSTTLYFTAAVLTVGVGGICWTYLIYRQDGFDSTVAFLLSTEDDKQSTKQSDESREKTPPAPESLKSDLYFDRANQECEWCEEGTDTPEVHHIEPRREGGPNEPRNLIVLCPGCHRKADRGTPSKTKLRQKVKRIENAHA